jgi:hypothetical protein
VPEQKQDNGNCLCLKKITLTLTIKKLKHDYEEQYERFNTELRINNVAIV